MRRRIAQDGIIGKPTCDCPRERQSKCHHPYHFDGGRDYRFSVDVQAGHHVAMLADARALGRVWLQQIEDGVFARRGRGAPVVEAAARATLARTGPTLDEFSAAYIRDCSLLKSAGKELKDVHHRDFYVFQPLLRFRLADNRRLGELPFASVTEAMYERYISARREQDYAASTVNKDVVLIRAMVNWASRRGWYGPNALSPISGESDILVQKSHAKRHRAISDWEFQAIHEVCDQQLWAYIKLSLITCARLTELYRLRWSDHLGLTLRVRPDATKTESAERHLPLDDEALEILGRLRVDPAGRRYASDDFIMGEYGEPPRDINDRFKTMLLKAFPERDRAGEPLAIVWKNGDYGPAARQRLDAINLVFGDFRHEGALRKYRLPAPHNWLLNELQALLGHSNLVQTSTYLGLAKEEVMRAMAMKGSGAKVGTGQSLTNPDNQSKPIRGDIEKGANLVTH